MRQHGFQLSVRWCFRDNPRLKEADGHTRHTRHAGVYGFVFPWENSDGTKAFGFVNGPYSHERDHPENNLGASGLHIDYTGMVKILDQHAISITDRSYCTLSARQD